MTKLITIFIIVVAVYCGFHLFLYWEKVRDEEALQKKAAAEVFRPERLAGLPPALESSLRTAQQKGPVAVQAWLKTYGSNVQDPRKAWIELAYVMSIARDNPADARRIFGEVKQRTPPASPLWPQIKELEKSFQ